MINLNNKSKKLLLLQRNELLSEKQKFLRKKFGRLIFTNFFVNFFQNKYLEKNTEELFQKEVDVIGNYIPNNAKNIMDIGCGLGIINIFLNKIYLNKANFYLLDKNRIDKKIKYGFNKNYESYNSLKETKKLLLNNGIDAPRINIFDVEKEISLNKKIDLVISLKSMGFHYPFENYFKLFKTCCTKDSSFIFDIAKERYSEIFFKNYFEEVNVIYEEKSIHPLKRLYCKKIRI